jgi:hypothetical protein
MKTTNQNTNRHTRRMAAALRRQTGTAIATGAVATALVALSLSHLAHGIEIVTYSPTWEAWAMAVGIDLGFVTIELSQVLATTEAVRRRIARHAKPAVAGTLIGSAAMNAFAFAAPATNYWTMAAGIALGISIPALIYAMTRIGAALYLDGSNKTA